MMSRSKPILEGKIASSFFPINHKLDEINEILAADQKLDLSAEMKREAIEYQRENIFGVAPKDPMLDYISQEDLEKKRKEKPGDEYLKFGIKPWQIEKAAV
jgi:hypothetical protein